MTKLNPHNSMTALDPPRFGERPADEPPRRWRCDYCNLDGTYDELYDVACSYVYPPCDDCGQTPECALDCRGIALALAGDDVNVIAGPPKGNA